ncbi:MAG: MBOAT family protein, partial [Chlorobi bacterium]|nr:MBOAT family protein [Chlorobiota bacterium]
MSFISLPFLVFLITVFTLFFGVKKKYRIKLLFIASLFYVGTFSTSFVIYVLVFTFINYSVGKKVYLSTGRIKKRIYFLGQILNIGSLLYFKYISFIIENINYPLSLLSGGIKLPIPDVLIPIGISYYTFQGISYLYLIYKAGDKPEDSFIDLGLYMIFFPKILAGPIERHRNFLPQLKVNPEFDYERIVSGTRLVMWGMFKKVVVADQFALIINKFYGDVDGFTGNATILVFLIQPLQVYFDFSGYTDMAIGIARIFGINLSENFNRPFMSSTVGEFWRRWHISLSSWFNDFVYNRLIIKHRKWGNKAVIYAIFISFTLIGLWHGAQWTFGVLGILQVIALIYEFMTRKWRKKMSGKINPFLLRWGSRLIVYMFFGLSLVFFFSHNMKDALTFFHNLDNVRDVTNFHFGFNIIRWEFFIALTFAFLFILKEGHEEDNGG